MWVRETLVLGRRRRVRGPFDGPDGPILRASIRLFSISAAPVE